MAKQEEGSLQERIKTLLRKRGAHCFKNHGDMTTEPGRTDITCGYRGLFIGIEAKVDDNTPSRQQGIDCRDIWKRGCIAFVTWGLTDVIDVLNHIDYCIEQRYITEEIVADCKAFMAKYKIDDGTRW